MYRITYCCTNIRHGVKAEGFCPIVDTLLIFYLYYSHYRYYEEEPKAAVLRPAIQFFQTNSDMPKKISDIALAKMPAFASRVALFQSRLPATRHAAGIITDYSHALYKAVAYIGKLPEEFTREDTDGYLKDMLERQPQPGVSQFKHFIYGLKSYLHCLGFSEPTGLALPKIRREKKLPQVMSVESLKRLLRVCDLYSEVSATPTLGKRHKNNHAIAC